MVERGKYSPGFSDTSRDLFLTFIVLFLTLLAGTIFYCLRFIESVHPYPPYSKEIIVERGSSTSQIGTLLQEEGLIHHALFFNVLVRITGQDPYLQAGSYRFYSDMSLFEIIRSLTKGMVITDTITIPEGFTIKELGLLLQEKLGITHDDFYGALDSVLAMYPTIGEEYRLKPHHHQLEGYLFPDTYFFPRDMDPKVLLNTMVERFFSQVGRYTMEESALALGLSLHQLVTIASLIEKEAKKPNERPLISGVIHNRLRLNMLLQIDATVLYILPERKSVVLYRDLEEDSSYNTYLYKGLPPGPIANPGLSSLQAALYPQTTEYLYYVAKRDGTHIFSRTYQQHQQAIRDARR